MSNLNPLLHQVLDLVAAPVNVNIVILVAGNSLPSDEPLKAHRKGVNWMLCRRSMQYNFAEHGKNHICLPVWDPLDRQSSN